MSQQPLPNDLKSLKERMNLIAAADPNQKQNEFSLIRYLRAFKDVDSAFKVIFTFNICLFIAIFYCEASLSTKKLHRFLVRLV